MFSKAPPLDPPTTRQLIMRARWRTAAAAWSAQTPEEREQWNTAATRGRLDLPGYALWVYAWTGSNTGPTIATIERQSETTLPNKP